MITVQRTFDVARPAGVVQDYLRDFAHAVEWDPGTQSCERIGPDGPVTVGTTWHNVSELKGRETSLTYELVSEEPGHLVFEGNNKTATSVDDITIAEAGDGARITYRAQITFHGIAKVAQPLFEKEFERLGDETQRSLIDVIAQLG